MISVSNILKFSLWVIFFTTILFMWDILFHKQSVENEEDFLEISVYEPTKENKIEFKNLTESILGDKVSEGDLIKKQEILDKIEEIKTTDSELDNTVHKEHLDSAIDIEYEYVPENFVSEITSDSTNFNWVLNWKSFKKMIEQITLTFYQERIDVRGKMKNKTIKFFGPNEMEDDELFGIFIHELSHYIDLYHLERIDWADISNNYYDISWYSTIVMNKWLTQKDFVSGYAMTNKYEDFAESLTYYVFHNNDFVVKMQDSDILEKKYSFIKNVIFSDESFIGTDFSLNNAVKSYYRDITKIDFSKKNFLQYVKNSI